MQMKKYQIFTNLKMNQEGKYGYIYRKQYVICYYSNFISIYGDAFIKFGKYLKFCVINKFGLLINLKYRGAYAIVKRAVNR